ncbi:MAG: hypothetical protein QOK22_2553 [Gaiellaceae bacterium]|nr:hypothetical protein [Gaiellaceae bacterium]
MDGRPVDVRILGSVEVRVSGNIVPLGGTARRLFTLFVLHVNRPLPVASIVDELWEGEPPRTAVKIIQNAVSRLRKLLGPSTLLTHGDAYELRLDGDALDAALFERLVADAGRLPLAESAEVLREALALWRGPALADVAELRLARTEAARLEEIQLAATESRIEAEVALGRSDHIAELEALVARHPLRERLRAQLMLALYRNGRQADALAVYARTRELLVGELGIEPGPELRRLERAILEQDPELELAPAPAAPPPAATVRHRPRRVTVTVLFADVIRSGTRLDVEVHHDVTRRADIALARVVTDYGGVAERLAGGGIVGIFGMPTAHEDDAVRAVRAASELQGALAGLNEEVEQAWAVQLAVRVALDTGEALARDDAAGVSGPVVESAARLLQVAEPGRVLVGQGAAPLVEAAARLEPAGGALVMVELLEGATSIARRLDVPLVGRERELALLRDAFDRAVATRSAAIVTLLGPPGIGKSKLAREFAARLHGSVEILTGHCLSYGEGITLSPAAEVVRQAVGEPVGASVERLLAGDADAAAVADRVAGALGAVETTASPEETRWAFRRLFEALARRRSLVLVFEDLHWAEPAFLDLVEHVVDGVRDAPMLVLCTARPEALESRPSLAGGRPGVASAVLEPLSKNESDQLLEHLAGDVELEAGVRERITAAAEGNPLFLEQMLAMVGEQADRDEELVTPPTIRRLLSARLDQLEPREREVLERASVIGRDFWRAAVVELVEREDRAEIDQLLTSLVRKELVQAAPTRLARDDGFRFHHELLRESAYDAVPKLERANLHERFADWLEREAGERAGEVEELLGYHLEQAYRCRTAVAPPDEAARAVAARAAERLAAAGRRAHALGDASGAAALLGRAAALLEPGAEARPELLVDLADAQRESGDYPAAETTLAAAVESAAADERLEAYALVSRLRMRLQTSAKTSPEEIEREGRRAIAVFEQFGDARGLAKAWELLAWAPWFRCRAAATEEALAHALVHARHAGDMRLEAQILNLAVGAAFFGPTPVPEAIGRAAEILEQRGAERRIAASALRSLAGLHAMQGHFDEARALLARYRGILGELGLRVTAASAAETSGIVELLAGDPVAAERELRWGYAELERMGVKTTRANLVAVLAEAVHAQGRDDEALAWSEVSERGTAPGDLYPQVRWRSARAKALARLDRLGEAEQLAREAVALAEQTDFLDLHGDAQMALAEVLQATGRLSEAADAIGSALELYERKQNLVSATIARRGR